MVLCTVTTNAADIIGYLSKEKGDEEYKVITGRSISVMEYDDEVLIVRIFNGGMYRFEVSSSEEAKSIITKVLDPKDSSLIELNW
jgi:hypothetical protein